MHKNHSQNQSHFPILYSHYQTSEEEWITALDGNTTSGITYNVTIGEGEIDPLTPYTEYQVRTVIEYTSGSEYTYTGDEGILAAMTEGKNNAQLLKVLIALKG